MYWIYLIIFILAVLTPDIIQNDFLFLSEKRAEELLIFFLGMVGFLLFMWMERELFIKKREKSQDAKKIDRTIKDLVESYSYIGEVNRKMDILMNISLGLTEKSNLSKNKQNEIYHSIIEAAKFLMKADCVHIKFINTKSRILERESRMKGCSSHLGAEDILKIGGDIFAEKVGRLLITSSYQEINNVRCYLIIDDFDEQENKTIQLLKVMASQALFVYSYAGNTSS